MFILSNVLQALAVILDYVLWLYMWIIIARALISWVESGSVESHRAVSSARDGTGALSHPAPHGICHGNRSFADHRLIDHHIFASRAGTIAEGFVDSHALTEEREP